MDVRLDEDLHFFAAVRTRYKKLRFHPFSLTEATCLHLSMLAGRLRAALGPQALALYPNPR